MSKEGQRDIYTFKDIVELKVEKVPIIKSTVTRKGEKHDFYVNAYTSKSSTNLDDVLGEGMENYQIVPYQGKTSLGVKFMYDANVGAVAAIFCELDTSSLSTVAKWREWTEIQRAYIFPDKTFYKNNYYNWWSREEYGPEEYVKLDFSMIEMHSLDKFTSCCIIDADGILEDENGKKAYDAANEMKPFHQLWGPMVNLSGNRILALDSIFVLSDFMNYKQPVGKKNKKQERLDELLAYKLPEVDSVPEDIPEIKRDFGYYGKNLNPLFENVQKYAVIQKVSDSPEPMCVIRTFFKSSAYDIVKEGGRIYIGKKEIISSRTMMDGNYIYQALLNAPIHWNFYIEDFNEEETRGTILEYYGSIVDKIERRHRGLAIWCFMKHPFLEQMYKMDVFRPFLNNMFRLCIKSTPIDILNLVFGKIDTDQKNVWKILGINKKQAEILMPIAQEYLPLINAEGWAMSSGPIKMVKFILGNDDYYSTFNSESHDISSVDEDTIRSLSELLLKFYRKYPVLKEYSQQVYTDWHDAYSNYSPVNDMLDVFIRALYITRKTYGMPQVKKMGPILFKHHARGYGNRSRYASCLILYYDYVDMVAQLNLQATFKPMFSTAEQIAAKHDMILELYNMNRDLVKHEKWKKNRDSKNWKKWEYEDGSFKVVAPVEPEELAKEGCSLCHCVKSYIGRVADGSTNIMFIRKVEDPEVPFFTVEVDNSNIIQQVHGLCNCNADTVDGLPEFVKKWAKEKKLGINTYNKVR